MEQVLTEILKLLGVFITSALSILIPYIGVSVGKYVKLKLDSVKNEEDKKLALDIVKLVEERYRLGELTTNKVDEFNKLVLEKCPYVTEQELKDMKDLAVRTFDENIGKYVQ